MMDEGKEVNVPLHTKKPQTKPSVTFMWIHPYKLSEPTTFYPIPIKTLRIFSLPRSVVLHHTDTLESSDQYLG